jgi:hypothetical protein
MNTNGTNQHRLGIQSPIENVECFKILHALENSLRELIIEELNHLDGSRWYKTRLPGDVLKKYREGLEFQKHVPWMSLVPHHPIYYIDFADLKKILEREDNWKDAFSPIFERKDIISATLSELEPIRNSLAHNRRLTAQDLGIVESAIGKLIAAMGEERFRRLAASTSTATTISEDLTRLRTELTNSIEACKKYAELDGLTTWLALSSQWWFGETYLGHSLADVEWCFVKFVEYGLNSSPARERPPD